jgi:hypothetical protein
MRNPQIRGGGAERYQRRRARDKRARLPRKARTG